MDPRFELVSPTHASDTESEYLAAANGDPSPASLPPKEDAWKPFITDASDIIFKEIPPVIEIIEGIICEQSKLVLGSGSKSYKTWLTIDLALSVSHGVTTLGRKTSRRKVMYVNLELKSDTFERRLQAVARAKGLAIEPGWFFHLPLRGKLTLQLLQVTITRLIAICLEKGFTVIVLDPVAMLNTLGDENSSKDQVVLMNEIDRMTTEASCTVILNDHFGKGNQSEKDPLDAIRGSSAKGGAIDAAMIIRKHDVDDAYRVDMIHRELPPVEPFVIGWNYPLMELRADLDPEDMKKSKGGRPKDFTLSFLLEPIKNTSQESSITISAWSKILGIPRKTLSDNLAELRKRDYIKTTGEGTHARQYITEIGLVYLENEP